MTGRVAAGAAVMVLVITGFIPATANAATGMQHPGQKLYIELCASCHGKDKRGGVGPDLTVSTFKYGKNRTAITTSIRDGRPGGMPGFSAYLDRNQLDALATYILFRP